MPFTYTYGSNPEIDFPRLLIGDTVEEGYIFDDREIAAMYRIQQSQFQSAMLYSGGMGSNLPASPVSYLRVAALLLDSLASAKARLAGVTKLLDVSLDIGRTQKALREQAATWREVDDESGAFVMIEQCNTSFGFIQRYNSQIQRQCA